MERLVLAAVLALGLTACPAEDPVAEQLTPPPDDETAAAGTITEAARTTLEAGTARAQLTLGTQVPLLPAAPGEPEGPDDEPVEADPGTELVAPGPGEQGLQVFAEEDFDADRRRLTVHGSPEAHPGAGVAVGELLVDGSILYLRTSGTAAPQAVGPDDGTTEAVPVDHEWLRVDLDEVEQDWTPVLLRDAQMVLVALRDTELQVSEHPGGEAFQVTLEPDTMVEEVRTWWDAVATEPTEVGELDVWTDGQWIERVDYYPGGRTGIGTVDVEEVTDPEATGLPSEFAVSVEYLEFGVDLPLDLPEDAAVTDIDPDALRALLPVTFVAEPGG